MIDMSSAAVPTRLRDVGARSDLRSDHRLDQKLDMSPSGIARRLASVEAAPRLGLALVEIGRGNQLGRRA